jgi:HK97 family phage major capsid protein
MEITMANLAEQVTTVGKSVENAVEQWRQADATTRKDLEAKITKLEDAYQKLLEKQAQEARTHLPGTEGMVTRSGEKNKFSYGRALKLITKLANPNDKEFGFEVEVFKNMEKNFDGLDPTYKTAINAATGAGGAFLIPIELYGDIIKEAQANSIATMLGVRELWGLVGNIQWVKDQGGTTASYIDTEAEETGSESTPSFAAIEVKPHVLGAFVPMTWSMLSQPAIALDQWIIGIIAKKIALRKDKSIFVGQATLKEPRGITNTPGGNTAVNFASTGYGSGGVVYSWDGTNTQTLTDALMDMISTLAASNTFVGATKLGWAFDPFVVTKIGKCKDRDGNPIFALRGPNEALAGRIQNMFGYKLGESTQLGSSSSSTLGFGLFGDFNRCIDCNWGTLAFASSNETETNFRKLRTTVRAILAHDVMVEEPKAFVSASNFNST